MHNASSSSALDDTYGEREGEREREGEKEGGGERGRELLAAISSRSRMKTFNRLREDDVPMG